MTTYTNSYGNGSTTGETDPVAIAHAAQLEAEAAEAVRQAEVDTLLARLAVLNGAVPPGDASASQPWPIGPQTPPPVPQVPPVVASG